MKFNGFKFNIIVCVSILVIVTCFCSVYFQATSSVDTDLAAIADNFFVDEIIDDNLTTDDTTADDDSTTVSVSFSDAYDLASIAMQNLIDNSYSLTTTQTVVTSQGTQYAKRKAAWNATNKEYAAQDWTYSEFKSIYKLFETIQFKYTYCKNDQVEVALVTDKNKFSYSSETATVSANDVYLRTTSSDYAANYGCNTKGYCFDTNKNSATMKYEDKGTYYVLTATYKTSGTAEVNKYAKMYYTASDFIKSVNFSSITATFYIRKSDLKISKVLRNESYTLTANAMNLKTTAKAVITENYTYGTPTIAKKY